MYEKNEKKCKKDDFFYWKFITSFLAIQLAFPTSQIENEKYEWTSRQKIMTKEIQFKGKNLDIVKQNQLYCANMKWFKYQCLTRQNVLFLLIDI